MVGRRVRERGGVDSWGSSREGKDMGKGLRKKGKRKGRRGRGYEEKIRSRNSSEIPKLN